MGPVVEPIAGATLGAMITGIDLNDCGGQAWRAVEDAFLEHAVLVFPAQHLGADAQVAFGRRFGEIEILRDDGREGGTVHQQEAGRQPVAAGRLPLQDAAGQRGLAHGQHLHAGLRQGGAAVRHRGAGDRRRDRVRRHARRLRCELDDRARERIAGLSAYHSLYASQAKIGHLVGTGSGYGYHDKGAPVRPLVKTHPVTGRKALQIARHIYRIPGLDDDDAEALIADLLQRSCRPPRVYTHRWQPGDLLVWDNRCVLHRARPYDRGEPRVLQATRIAGDPATELAPTTRDERAAGFQPSTENR